MSAGAFSIAKYTTNLGNVVAIRVQPETLDATFSGSINASPGASTLSSGFPSASVSGSRRSIGIHPRTVNVRISAGLPTGYLSNQIYRIPCLNQTAWDNATKGAAAGYLGGTGIIVSKSPESIN